MAKSAYSMCKVNEVQSFSVRFRVNFFFRVLKTSSKLFKRVPSNESTFRVMITCSELWQHVQSYEYKFRVMKTSSELWQMMYKEYEKSCIVTKQVQTNENRFRLMRTSSDLWEHVQTYGNRFRLMGTSSDLWEQVQSYENKFRVIFFQVLKVYVQTSKHIQTKGWKMICHEYVNILVYFKCKK